MHVPGYKTVLSFYRTSQEKRLTLYYCSFLIVLVISFPSPSVAQVSQVDNDFSAGGGIRIGAAAGTCDGTIDGALRYNTGNLEVCNGSAWLTTLTSSLNPVVNNGNSFSAAMVIGTNDSNTLSFETNGTTHMTISTSGDVGIGTTSPSSALDLNGATTTRAMAAPAISSAGQGRIYFDSTSNTFKVSENGGAYSNLVNTSNGDFLADGSVPMTGAFLAASSGTAAAPSISFNGDSNTGFRGTGDSLYISTGGTERGYFDSYGSFNWYATIGMSRTKHGNGSASYPSVSFTNSENTGLFRPAYNVLAISTASTERVRINAAGNVGIGTTAPNVALDVIGDIEYTGVITDVSDRRRKEDIQPLQNGLATIEKIDGVSFVMKGDESKRVEFGVIAQDVEKVLPELVHVAKDEDQTRSVNYIGFIGWMIEAIKDLARGDRQLQKQLNAKDQKISELEDRVQKLEEFILKNK